MSGLLPITDRDWSVRAGTLEWDCWRPERIGDSLLSYAWQLAVQPTARYVRAVATAEKDASRPRCSSSPSPAGGSWRRWSAPPAARPGVPPGRRGRPGGLRRDGLPRGPAGRQRHRAGVRPQPRPAARRLPPGAVPDVPADPDRPRRRRPVDGAAVGGRPSNSSVIPSSPTGARTARASRRPPP